MRILVTGATGYVGGRLVPQLLEAGHDVRVTTRDGRAPSIWWADRVETVAMDMLASDDVEAAVKGMDAVYYLVHGMGHGRDFEATDRRAAKHLRGALDRHGVGRVIYLSGLVPPDPDLSPHMRSRYEVEQILTSSDAVAITVRAAVLVGAASTSFELIRQLAKRFAVQGVPPWLRSDVQPVAAVDVLTALVGALDAPPHSRSYDVGGPDRLAYADLLAMYSRVAGLTRVQVPLPWVPRIAAQVVASRLSDVPGSTVWALIESLSHDMVVLEDDFLADLMPAGHTMVPTQVAIARALAPVAADPETGDPMAPWPTDPDWVLGTGQGSTLGRLIGHGMDIVDRLNPLGDSPVGPAPQRP